MMVGSLQITQQLTLSSEQPRGGEGLQGQSRTVTENAYPVKGEKGPEMTNHGDLRRDQAIGSIGPGP